MDQAALIASAGEQLKNFGNFLEQNDKKLSEILQQQQHKLMHQSRPYNFGSLIQLDYGLHNENLSLIQLLESDGLLNKILLTFIELCSQINDITKEAQHFEKIFLYLDTELLVIQDEQQQQEEEEKAGDVVKNEITCKDNEDRRNRKNERLLLKMSESIEFLFQLQFLMQHCIILGNNLLQQCGAFISGQYDHHQHFSGIEIKLTCICDYLSNLIYHILLIDSIVKRSNFAQYWPLYKKTIEVLMYDDITRRECSQYELEGLKNSIQELNFLFGGNCLFRNFLDSTFGLKEKIGTRGIGLLTQRFNDYLRQQLAHIETINPHELNDFIDGPTLIKLNAFCVVFHEVCGQVDSKSFKHLLELNAKYHGIVLIANIPWCPTDFLRKNASLLIKPYDKYLIELKKQQQLFLNYHNLSTLKRTCHLYCTQITAWTLQMSNSFKLGPFDLHIEQYKRLTGLFWESIQTAGKLSFLIKAIISAHESLQQPITKQCLLCVCKLLELLKVIQFNIQKFNVNIAKILPCIIQYLQYKVLYLLNSYKKTIISSKLGESGIEALAAVKITERCLLGTASPLRILVAKISFDTCHVKKRALTGEQKNRVHLLFQRIELLAQLQNHITHICDSSFLECYQSILTVYLKEVMERKLSFKSVPYILSVGNDTENALEKCGLNDLHLNSVLKKANYENVRTEIISKLCAQIEIYLRLEVHSDLHVNTKNLYENESAINDYTEMINSGPIQMNGNYIILKDHIENYISVMFYNLTTISLHDWKTYEEMRHLSNRRFILNPINDNLPNQTLEQGIDILEIMRKINIFVAKYMYNMNSQIFVEQHSHNKHLDTIGIRHIANSLRTHGTGVISTAVNIAYQFLRQKFYTFSQFLYDEQINARLMKEVRSFAERSKADIMPLYPYERAEAFNKDIRKLGLTKDGQTYMDLFRKVITHVGNTLGYIRLVRSGSIHANYSSSLHLPNLNKNVQFVEECKKDHLSSVTLNAAENLEINIENLIKHYAEDIDFFKLLVDAFQPFFRNPKNIHLKSFFLIAPAVIMNYIEYMLKAKEKINKRDHEKAVLFDDGFPIGLAYIFKLLNQITDFNSLQWFLTVRQRFDMERQKINEMLLEINNASKTFTKSNTNAMVPQKHDNDKLQQTLVLTERRINAHQMEYNLLFYNLCSAKIFFQ